MAQISMPELIQHVSACGDFARAERNQLQLMRKADGSLVTHVDEAIEQRLVAYLQSTYPDHAIVGEEGTAHNLASGATYTWVIDPIDGTSAFAGQLPGWCIGIGLLKDGQPIAGVVYAPMNDELFVATPNGQALRNNQPIHCTASQSELLDDWVAMPSDIHRKYQITYPGRIRTTGATIMSLCYVAAGMAKGALIGSCKVWDISPAMALLYYAGADLWDMQGIRINAAAYLNPPIKTPTMIAAPAAQADFMRDMIHPIA
ncbi:MAG: inositol monophosphatase family protein [Roseiflexaceae bacterium]|jgi:myo-inositol-1(or 4)-monophosphatase